MAVNDNDRIRPLHGSPACTCLFCWGEIVRLRAEVERLEGQRKLRADLAYLMKCERDDARTEVSQLMDGMELALSIIVNGQYWDETDAVLAAEWEQAKLKWRDEHWHPALDRRNNREDHSE